MGYAVKPENYRTCSCGKVCKGGSGLATHARKCPVERARVERYLAENAAAVRAERAARAVEDTANALRANRAELEATIARQCEEDNRDQWFGQDVLLRPTERMMVLAPSRYEAERGAVAQVCSTTNGFQWSTGLPMDRADVVALRDALTVLLDNLPTPCRRCEQPAELDHNGECPNCSWDGDTLPFAVWVKSEDRVAATHYADYPTLQAARDAVDCLYQAVEVAESKEMLSMAPARAVLDVDGDFCGAWRVRCAGTALWDTVAIVREVVA
jgi:hypothetical protein